jgi:hypothetical protein
MPPVSLNYCHVHSIPSLYSYYNFEHQNFPLFLKTLSSRSAFPLSLRGTRVAFLLLRQFSSSSSSRRRPKASPHYSSNSLLARLTRGEPRPGWMRVLAMEIMLR